MHIISFYLGLKFNYQNVDQLKIFFEKIRQTFVAMLNFKNKPVNENGDKKVMMKWFGFEILQTIQRKRVLPLQVKWKEPRDGFHLR